ncbi:hypothetical protein DFA_02036 [Cavenderia fasciculata]|uniref:Uncharacterized protein n=1 Tax=Cavenderia fasciculata TaxID=261658 RepID=F4PYI4_CACFS|nr:uncharacterized protein DFA_02036 [Cavenderia fasciculata]EGG19250.1 hypothetical protein DFA_02036 [Cavenderia fasciculata]|eukprot:XP_004357521.1 hypothetical protein DFA_02036 [Cavenderia fasciculata]
MEKENNQQEQEIPKIPYNKEAHHEKALIESGHILDGPYTLQPGQEMKKIKTYSYDKTRLTIINDTQDRIAESEYRFRNSSKNKISSSSSSLPNSGIIGANVSISTSSCSMICCLGLADIEPPLPNDSITNGVLSSSEYFVSNSSSNSRYSSFSSNSEKSGVNALQVSV